MGERVPITITQWLGLMLDLQESQMPVGALAEAVDCDLHPYLRSRLSPVSFFSVPSGQIVRRVGYLDTSSRFLVLTEAKAYRVDSNGSNVTEITPSSGFSGGSWWQVAQQERALYFVNGVDFIGRFDGTSISYLTANGAPRGARFIASYQGHLVAADVLDANSVRQRHWVRLSDIFNPLVWNAGVATDVKLDTRSPISGLVVTQNTLVVFTENEIWNIPYVGGSPPVIVQKQWEGVGCVAAGSLAATPDGQIFFLAEDGFYRYSVGSQPELISPNMSNWLRANFNRSRSAEVMSGIIPQRGIYVVVLPTGSTSQTVFAYHYRVNAWTQYNITMSSMQTLSLPEWVAIISQNNNVLRWIGASGVSYNVRLPLCDWGIEGFKRFDSIEIVSNEMGGQVTVTVGRSNIPSSPTYSPSRTAIIQPVKNKVYDSASGVYLTVRLQGSIGIERVTMVIERKGVRVG